MEPSWNPSQHICTYTDPSNSLPTHSHLSCVPTGANHSCYSTRSSLQLPLHPRGFWKSSQSGGMCSREGRHSALGCSLFHCCLSTSKRRHFGDHHYYCHSGEHPFFLEPCYGWQAIQADLLWTASRVYFIFLICKSVSNHSFNLNFSHFPIATREVLTGADFQEIPQLSSTITNFIPCDFTSGQPIFVISMEFPTLETPSTLWDRDDFITLDYSVSSTARP